MSGGLRSARQVGLAIGLVLALSACWPVPGQNPDRTGHNPYETRITVDTVASLTESWTAHVDGQVRSPVLSVGHVHVTDRAAAYSFDVSSGRRLWRTPLTPDIEPCLCSGEQAFVEGDSVLASTEFGALGGGGVVRWLDVDTGAVERETSSGPLLATRTPRAISQYTFRGSDVTPEMWLEVVDLETGSTGTLGFVGRAFGIEPPPLTMGGQRLYTTGSGVLPPFETLHTPSGDITTYGNRGNGIRALSYDHPRACIRDGQTFVDPNYLENCGLWATPLDGTSATAPVVGPGEETVYAGTDAGTVYAVEPSGGAVLWSAAVGSAVTGPPALADGLLYVPTADDGVVVLAAEGCGAATCDPLWSAPTSAAVQGQPVVAGGVVFVALAGGGLRAFDAAGCEAPTCPALWSAETGAEITGAPAVSGGRLYVGTEDGRLISYA